ncbi:hypothetical protein LR48_Vigan09g089200 [Vigna angularis]|uniref:Uncharacterized protein n=1 Tax=Phaseolus angularis TaxID=3914 RepID=A0A0L9VB52_PHAAN|nr:hypothetical protein LR48_Vigan09g089200 [Vigna angularis]
MASSSQPSRGNEGKEMAVTRGVDPEGWISSDATRERFLRGRVKIMLSLSERLKSGQWWIATEQRWWRAAVVKSSDGGEQGWWRAAVVESSGGWLKTQELSKLVQMKGDWFPNLVKVFYHNLKIVNGDIWSKDVMTTKDICLLHAIKNDIPTNWVDILKDHTAEATLNNSHYLPYVVLISKLLVLKGVDISGEQKCSYNCTNVINRNTIASFGLVKTVRGWCFKGEEEFVYSSGSTCAVNDDRRNFVPETNFERYVVDQFR